MTKSIEIKKYCKSQQAQWDALVRASASGTFLFLRDYMEYHAHRFVDFSLMIYERNKLVALLPASRHDNKIVSHGGLTYGGFLALPELSSEKMLSIFDAVADYLRQQEIQTWEYKVVPYIYQLYPHAAEEYALYRLNATRIACNLSSAIDLATPLQYAELRRRCIKRAQKQGVTIHAENNFEPFWEILQDNLQERHGIKPVHSLQEITLLHNLFPNQIQLHTAMLNNKVVAGCVVYNTGRVAHAQYISASPEGKECGALDLLFAHLIENVYTSCRYFDFGISTEEGGNILNQGLLSQKEGFGARGVLYETYRIEL
ncbi:MAG: GNAT family N-acetyltransferase [Bacteroidaceae bacterium]|nr:GNAT family N-acetyltransferase [Bacteroidaceae bacterium]